MFCVCGKVAEMVCTACKIQGYCSEVCQKSNEDEHRTVCTRAIKATEEGQSKKARKISAYSFH